MTKRQNRLNPRRESQENWSSTLLARFAAV
jgi:hypothetical protein